jgi:hypothetical protein
MAVGLKIGDTYLSERVLGFRRNLLPPSSWSIHAYASPCTELYGIVCHLEGMLNCCRSISRK